MLKKTLYSALFRGEYPFGNIFETVTTVINPDEMVEDNSVLIIWGGGDISPTLYNHGVSKLTGASEDPSGRDLYELDLARHAVDRGIPIIGICRGAQLMCAVSGGYLIQDVTGHTSAHDMTVIQTGEILKTSSLHHQMMYPWEIEHKMIAVSTQNRSRRYVTHPLESHEDILIEALPYDEPEIVWFPKTKSLAIQGHPEFMSMNDPFVNFCFDLVKKYV